MGFRLLSALGGAAKQYNKNVEQERETEMALFKEQMSRTMQSYDDAIKARNEKSTQLRDVGNTLRNLGLSDQQALVVLREGPEKAKALAERIANTKGILGDKFNASDIVTLANPEDTGLSFEDGLRNLVGIVSTEPSGTRPSSGYGSVRKVMDKRVQAMEAGYGKSWDEIQNMAFGRVERGDLPAGSLNTKDLYSDERLDRLYKQTQIASLQEDVTSKRITNATLEDFNNAKLESLRNDVELGDLKIEEYPNEIKRINEKHAVDMESARLGNEKDQVALWWQSDLLSAELNYTLAKTAGEIADAKDTGDLLKTSDVRNIMQNSVETALAKQFDGKLQPQADGSYLATFDPKVKAQVDLARKKLQLNAFRQMASDYGATSNVRTVFGSYAGVPVKVLPPELDTRESISEDSVYTTSAPGTIFVDSKGRLVSVAEVAPGQYKWVDPSQTRYWNTSALFEGK